MLRLTKERMAKGWSRAELARRSAMHPTDIGKTERKILSPYPAQLRRVARALRWPVGQAERLLEDVAEPAGNRGGDHGA